MLDIYYLPISDDSNIVIFNFLLSLLSKEKQEKIRKYHFEIDQKLSLYGELIVRVQLCKKYNITNNEIVFKIGKYGKPYLLNYGNFEFNISHTRNAVVVAVSDKSVGIDIEKIKKIDLKIAERFFVYEELQYIIENNNLQDERFFEIWTKKEAYIKYIGKGLSMPLNQFNVFDVALSKHYYTFPAFDYIISAFTDCDNEKINLHELTEKEIEKMAFEYLV